MDDALAGGIYGVAIGRMFFGESMFSRAHRRLEDARWRAWPRSSIAGGSAHRLPARDRPPGCRLGAGRLSARRDFVREVARLVGRLRRRRHLAARRRPGRIGGGTAPRAWVMMDGGPSPEASAEPQNRSADPQAARSTSSVPNRAHAAACGGCCCTTTTTPRRSSSSGCSRPSSTSRRPRRLPIMMHVHQAGIGVAGIYTRDVAETKVKATRAAGRAARVPAARDDGAGTRGDRAHEPHARSVRARHARDHSARLSPGRRSPPRPGQRSSTCCTRSSTSRRRAASCARCSVDLTALRTRPRRGARARRSRPCPARKAGQAGVDARLRSRRRAGGGARRLVERAAGRQRQPARLPAAGRGQPRRVLPAQAGRRSADAAARDLARRPAEAPRRRARPRAARRGPQAIRSRPTPTDLVARAAAGRSIR